MSSTRILPLFGSGLNPQDYYTKEQVDALIADFITNTVDDLVFYYSKSETYTQAEVQQLVGQITSFEVVSTLPVSYIKTNVIYLLGPTGSGADRYEEYIYSNNAWVKIGETSVDLSNYVTVTQLNTALGFYTPTAQLAAVATGGEIGDLTDVNISSPTNGQVMKYNATTQKWENGTGGGGCSVVELTQQQYDALVTPDPDTTYIITDADAIDMDDYALKTEIEEFTADKADKQNVTANPNQMKFPYWNEQGVITGATSGHLSGQAMYINGGYWRIFTDNWSDGTIYGPTSAGTSGQIVKSNGSGAPSWVNIETLTGGLKFWLGTQAQYDALAPNYDSSTLYVIQD